MSAVGTTPSPAPLSAYKTIAAGTTILDRGGRKGESELLSPPKDHYYLSFENKLPAHSFSPFSWPICLLIPSYPSRSPIPLHQSSIPSGEKYSPIITVIYERGIRSGSLGSLPLSPSCILRTVSRIFRFNNHRINSSSKIKVHNVI